MNELFGEELFEARTKEHGLTTENCVSLVGPWIKWPGKTKFTLNITLTPVQSTKQGRRIIPSEQVNLPIDFQAKKRGSAQKIMVKFVFIKSMETQRNIIVVQPCQRATAKAVEDLTSCILPNPNNGRSFEARLRADTQRLVRTRRNEEVAKVLAAFANTFFAPTVDAHEKYHNAYDRLTWKDLVVSPSDFENYLFDMLFPRCIEATGELVEQANLCEQIESSGDGFLSKLKTIFYKSLRESFTTHAAPVRDVDKFSGEQKGMATDWRHV